MKNIAYFDMDDTLVDYSRPLLNDLNRLRSPEESEITTVNPSHLPQYIKNRMHYIKNSNGWWENLPPIESSIKLLNLIKSLGYDVNILTKGPFKNSNGWSEKFNWCRKYFKNKVKINITEDKSYYRGDILVEDYWPYAKSWLQENPKSLVILIENYHNKGIDHPNVIYFNPDKMDQIKQKIINFKNTK